MQIEHPDRLTEAQQRAVRQVADAAGRADGSPPLNDAALLALPGVEVEHYLVTTPSPGPAEIVGYAQYDPTLGDLQAVVAVPHRGRGVGRDLLTRLRHEHPDAAIWSFGGRPDAARLAAELGWSPGRELLVMTRDLTRDPVGPPPPAPPGVTVRPFRLGVDEDAWVRVNARAFAHHPEQGRITVDHLQAREAEDWFDPAGFLLAWRAGQLVGYHWTKVHREQTPPAGEVYVLGVDPDAGRSGIGRALLDAGLSHLQGQGLTSVLLYVEADSDHVVNLYRSASFVTTHRDVRYVPTRDIPASPTPSRPTPSPRA